MAQIPVGLQLYTVREQLQADFAGTLGAVAKIGYPGVELAGYGGLGARDLRRLLDDLGLRVAGDHVGLNRLEQELEAVIAFSQELGNRYIVCPFAPAERRHDAAGWRQLAQSLEAIGRRVVEAGLEFCYHNHAFEFAPVDGTNGFSLLYDGSDPRYVAMELDMFWAVKGGDDPASILRRYPGRCRIVHLKDMTADAEQTFAEVGEGSLSFQPIFDAASVGGVAWFIVEQDRSRRSPLESARISFQHLRDWGVA